MYESEIKDALDKRQSAVNAAKAILDKAEKEKRDLSTDEDAQFARLHKEGDEWKAKADDWTAKHNAHKTRTELQERADREMADARRMGVDRDRFPASAAGSQDERRRQASARRNPLGQNLAQSVALQGWARHQNGIPVTDRHRAAAKKAGFRLSDSGIDIELPRNYRDVRRQIKAALSVTTGTSGGFATVPEGFVPSLEVAMLDFGPMLSLAQVMRTATGERMGWPTANDTGNSGRQIGEAAAVTSLDPAFGKKFWDAYKLTSDEVLVPFELLQDGAFDLASELGAMLGERLGRILNTKATVGTGAGTFTGVVICASAGKTTASGTAIAADEILDFQHSLGRAYRKNASFMCHDNVKLVIRKLKDSQGQYLWSPGLVGGVPDRLCNAPIETNDDMNGTLATGNISMLWGDFSKYKIRMVGSIRLYRLTERHRENDEDAFLAFLRADGNLLEAGQSPMKKMTQG